MLLSGCRMRLRSRLCQVWNLCLRRSDGGIWDYGIALQALDMKWRICPLQAFLGRQRDTTGNTTSNILESFLYLGQYFLFH